MMRWVVLFWQEGFDIPDNDGEVAEYDEEY